MDKYLYKINFGGSLTIHPGILDMKKINVQICFLFKDAVMMGLQLLLLYSERDLSTAVYNIIGQQWRISVYAIYTWGGADFPSGGSRFQAVRPLAHPSSKMDTPQKYL